MERKELLKLYTKDSLVQTIAHKVQSNKFNTLNIKGVYGSLLSILLASIYEINKTPQLIIANDKEDAQHIYSDIFNIIDSETVSFYTEEIENQSKDNYQNALVRTEVINNIIQQNSTSQIIVTYPEALIPKIVLSSIIKKELIHIKINDQIDVTEIGSILTEKKFIKKEFVNLPGEFAFRGGIIDIYSYSSQYPYRLELFGNCIENIKTFDPESQLSIKSIKNADIYNIQNTNSEIEKEPFFNILDKNTVIWKKNNQFIKSILESKSKSLINNNNDFLTLHSWEKALDRFSKIDLYNNPNQINNNFIEYDSSLQPIYNSKFEILSKDLYKYYSKQYRNLIVTNNISQGEKINEIILNNNSEIKLDFLNIGLSKGFIDHHNKTLFYTDHQILNKYYQSKSPNKFSLKKSLTIQQIQNLNIGDFVVHVDNGIGKFAGINKINNNGKEQEVIRLIYHNNDVVYVNIHNIHKIMKYSGKEGSSPKLSKLGSLNWTNKKKSIKRKVKEIAIDLISLYGQRKKKEGYAFKKDDTMQIALESSFLYEDTPDQAKATRDVKDDMEKPHPMDRLICGDVGFGKTEVAIRAAFKAVNDGKQVAILVPTTILSMQHFKSFKSRLKEFPVYIECINRFRTSKEKRDIIDNISKGTIDIIIGTHALLSKKVKFKNLGLLIIDEEQKFGVTAKEKIKEAKINIDVLTLTATPIPRTLHFSLMGARDLSIISTAPQNRQSIETYIYKFEKEIIRKAIIKELDRQGQVFFVNNKISNIDGIANIIKELVPKARIGVAHGRMDGKLLEEQMIKFIEKKYDILISTSIIESGLDIPNANTIIINQAHSFGLSDLHQMRGRVGRSNKKAYCYLLTPGLDQIPSDARKRLSSLEELSDIGDGFKVAMRDLDIRGAGNLLGGEQSGFIQDIGFEMYHRILDEAVGELKKSTFKDIFPKNNNFNKFQECNVETDLEILIPESYVQSQAERVNLYMKLDKMEDNKSLKILKHNLKDRFGPIPDPLEQLFQVINLRWIAKKIEINKLKLKNTELKCYFIKNNESLKDSFINNILGQVKMNPELYSFKETDKYLIFITKNVNSIEKAKKILEKLC